MWIIFSTRLSEHQRESIQWEYCLFLIIPSSKGRASNVNIVSTWLSRAPKEEHPRGILPRSDYPELQRKSIKGEYCLYSLPDNPELQRKSIQGEYCLYLIIPSSKGKVSKGNIVSTLYLIIPSSKGRAFKRNIASTWLSRAPRGEHPWRRLMSSSAWQQSASFCHTSPHPPLVPLDPSLYPDRIDTYNGTI